MAVEFISTDIAVAGVARTLVAGDLLVIRNTGSLTSTTDAAVVLSGSATLRVEGMIHSASPNLAIVGTADFGMTIDVTASGSILTETTAIQFNSPGTIINAGMISTDNSFAIQVGGGTVITNSGLITAHDQAIIVTGITDGGAIINSGVIRAGTGIGDIVSGSIAIVLQNATARITNTGLIECVSRQPGGRAILIDADIGAAGTVVIENAGTIRSQSTVAIDASLNTRDGLFITNTGLITGLTQAIVGSSVADTIINHGTLTVTADGATGVRLGDGGDTLRNRGVIETRVDMGDGADQFDGSQSDQGDYVFGGTGGDALIGGAFDDGLYGGDDNDRTYGGAGNDELIDSGGQDTIFGGAGDDVIGIFGDEVGFLSGGLGDDRIEGSTANDMLIGNAGDDTLIGGGGDDVYGISGLSDVVTELVGGGVADRVESGAISLDLNLYAFVERATLTGIGALRLTGNAGANTLVGNVAANVVTGGAGTDTIAGGGGADVITGGTGRDSLTGGAGADVFVLLSAAETGLTAGTRDKIVDFVAGQDDLRMIFMASFIGAAGFTAAGQVRYVAATGLLTGNTDADVAAEWAVQMATGLVLTSGDFVF